MIIGAIIASVAVCSLGAFSMYITKGKTGVGWAILGLFIIWTIIPWDGETPESILKITCNE